MTFDINEYKIKHIVAMNKDLLDDGSINLNIDGESYSFAVDNVATEIIEFVDYCKYDEINNANGPLEQRLKDFTEGNTYNELSEHEIYEIRFSKFKIPIEGDEHELEITGVGPKALKISLFIKFNDIESMDTTLEKELKEFIINLYAPLIENNKSYQEKLKELKEEYENEQLEREKIREQVRKEQEEKERKRKELEEILNSNKTSNDRPFKMY